MDPHWWQDPRNAVGGGGDDSRRALRGRPRRRGGIRGERRRLHRRDPARRPHDRRMHETFCRTAPASSSPRTTRSATSPTATTSRSWAPPFRLSPPRRSHRAARRPTSSSSSRTRTCAPCSPRRDSPVSSKSAIAGEADVAVGGELYADALGEEGSAGDTYLGALDANASALVKGLSDGVSAVCPLPGGRRDARADKHQPSGPRSPRRSSASTATRRAARARRSWSRSAARAASSPPRTSLTSSSGERRRWASRPSTGRSRCWRT